MRNLNPSLPTTAVSRKYRAPAAAALQMLGQNGGRSALKTNNFSDDIREHERIIPLKCVKEDVVGSANTGIQDLKEIIDSMLEGHLALMAEIGMAIQSDGSHKQLVNTLARRLLNSNLEARVPDSVSHIGSTDWRDPSGGQRKERI
jgi:disulfide oxidoreductase YuzD